MVALKNRLRNRGLPEKLSYDALEPKGRRKNTNRRPVREDHHTKGSKRKNLQENAHNLCRNMSIAAWMIRMHLDYVSNFEFHGRNDDKDLNDQLERLMKEDSVKQRADAAGRFTREKLFRLAEAQRCLGGDTGFIKLKSGHLQGIRGDLIGDPDKPGRDKEWVDGVQIGPAGRHVKYGIHKRTSNTKTKFAKSVPAKSFIFYGFFEGFAADQVRGVSPIVAALNPLRDVYENIGYALAKAKVEQLFALAFFRDASESAGNLDEEGQGGGEDDDDDEPTEYKVDFGGGPVLLDLDPGDKAEFLQSSQPSNQFQDFTKLVVQVAMKALDLPFSFFDESFTNFFGSIAGRQHYERACSAKHDDQIEMRTDYTIWKQRQWIRDKRLILPRRMKISDIKTEWVPKAIPWWDKAKEIRGDNMSISAGLSNPEEVCKKRGNGDVYENIRITTKVLKFAEDHGNEVLGRPLALSFDPGQPEPVIKVDSVK